MAVRSHASSAAFDLATAYHEFEEIWPKLCERVGFARSDESSAPAEATMDSSTFRPRSAFEEGAPTPLPSIESNPRSPRTKSILASSTPSTTPLLQGKSHTNVLGSNKVPSEVLDPFALPVWNAFM
jgi:hypothetical protein